MIANWLKIYGANLRKNKVYFILTILGLAIGIWGVLLTYLYYQEEIRYDQWNPYKEEIYIVSADLGEDNIWMLAPYPVGPFLKNEKQVIDDYIYLTNYLSGSLEIAGEKKRFTKGLNVQANFFAFFPFEIVEGDHTIDQPQSAFVLDTYAEELFGAQALGKQFRYQEEWFTIRGIYSLGDTRSSIAPHILFSRLDQVVKDNQDNWGNYNASLYLKIKDPTTLEAVKNAISDLMYDNVYTRLAREEGKTVAEFLEEEGDTLEQFQLFSLAGQHMIADDTYSGTLEPAINIHRFYILIGLSLTILFLSVVNYINLSIVQNLKRHREIGMRLVLGSTPILVFGQLFFESCLTLLFALGLSFVLIEFSLPFIQVFLDSKLDFYFLQGVEVGAVFLISLSLLLAGLLFFIMRKFSILSLLKGQVHQFKQSFGLRQLMLIAQFAIASFFIIGTTVVYQQVNYMLDKDLGFNKEQTMIIPFSTSKTGEERAHFYELYKTELLKIPGVEAVGSSSLPLGGEGYNSSSASHLGVSVQLMNVGVDEDFLHMMEIKITEGRNFNPYLATDSISSVLINRQLRDKFGDPAILGKSIRWNDRTLTVVGIVDNYHVAGFKSDYAPMLFFPLPTVPWLFGNIQELYVRFNATEVERIQTEIEKIYDKVNKTDYPFECEFLDKRFEKAVKSTIQERNILLVLSIIVIFIALFGLYSLVSFALANQYKEIAIRKVLGASNALQMKQLSKQYVVIGILGFILATYPSYYLMNRWLSDYAFRIELGMINFIYSFFLLMFLTLVTVLIKVHQAVRVNVVKHLKYE